jgi:Flp pilus assembly protein TadD
VLFVIWANTDRWFLLGLATAALVYLGRWVDCLRGIENETDADSERQPTVSKRSLTAEEAIVLGGRLLVSLALLAGVCLFNPEHVRAFTHFRELLQTGTATLVAHGEQLWSPFQERYLNEFGTSPAALAYYPLLGLGLLSFIPLFPRVSAQGVLPWLGLAALSAVQVRTSGFFAVVAGPVAAWNLAQIVARSPQVAEWRHNDALCKLHAGLTAALGVGLLISAWPGRLQLPPFEPRRWSFEFDPSLEQGVRTIQQWRSEGKLVPELRLLHLRAETVNAFAWFAPEEPVVVDAELKDGVQGVTDGLDNWQQRMRTKKVGYVILYASERDEGFTDFARLLADPKRWPLIYLEGGVALFGWRDPARRDAADPFRSKELDVNRLAYRPSEEAKAPRNASVAQPDARRWWHEFRRPLRRQSIARQEGSLRLVQADAMKQDHIFRHVRTWEAAQSAGLVGASLTWLGGAGSCPAALVDAHFRLVYLRPIGPSTDLPPDRVPAPDRMALALLRSFARAGDDVHPALFFLAMRAARRALAVNPDDARAYMVLAESYLGIFQATRERVCGQQMEELLQLRRTQALTALNQAVALKPDLERAHAKLAALYEQMEFFDLRLKHLRIYQELRKKRPIPADPMEAEAFQSEQAQLQKVLDRLTKSVAKREDEYLVASVGRPVLERAIRAKQKGLAGKARDMLLESHVSAFGERGMELELELLLLTGRARDVWEWTGPEQQTMLGPEKFHMLRFLALAATGEYARAEEECTQLNREMVARLGGRGDLSYRHVMSLMIGQAVLDDHPAAKTWPEVFARWGPRSFEAYRRVGEWTKSLKREADVKVLRGLICLEEGEIAEAELAFREALDLWKSPEAAESGAGLDFNGRRLAQGYLRLLESVWDSPKTRRQGDKETGRQTDKKQENVLP